MKLPKDEFEKIYNIAGELIKRIAKEEGVDPKYVRTRRKTPGVSRVRRRVAAILRMDYGLSFPNIGKCLNVGHSAVILMLKRGKQTV